MNVPDASSAFLDLSDCFDALLCFDGGGEEASGRHCAEGLLEGANVRQRKSARKFLRFTVLAERRRSKRKEEHRRRRRAKAAGGGASALSLGSSLEVCVDLSFMRAMSNKELARLVRQMGRVWGLQKRYVGLQVTLLSPSGRFLNEGRRVLSGFDDFQWNITTNALYLDECQKSVVYLSPDADLLPLLEVSNDSVFVVGGLVDETGVGSLSRARAERLQVKVRRLPISEFMVKRGTGTFNTMLSINHVVEILARVGVGQSWLEALAEVVPKRTGYVAAV